ncbi:MAG: hypothetical protein LR015_08450 [Verrucomicrobia bacterium]|nr:hypothetical protein [Verrucomicrobiota bacterium]
MQLTQVQQSAVRQWIEAGKTLSEVQTLLRSEHGLSLTYMDVRFLVDDLALEIKSPAKPKADAKTTDLSAPAEAQEPAEDDVLDMDPVGEPASAGPVKVSLDRITRPGAVVSGQVTFSDGTSAQWSLDQMGRLGLSGTAPGYKPNQQDIIAFQQRLQELLSSSGY